ncbi:MAG: hypothetical protein ACOX85_07680, partial [Candidatus Pararuminococcus gallinarum]
MAKVRRRRWLALVLALAIVLTMLPSTVFAIETDQQVDNFIACQKTEGCTLSEGHEGDCMVDMQSTTVPPAALDPSDNEDLAKQIQVRIDALPDTETLAGMSTEEQQAVYTEVLAIYDAIKKLTEGENTLDLVKLEAAADFFTTLVAPTVDNPAAKVGDDEYETLALAIENATDGATVVLMRDTEEDAVIAIDNSITLDLNGHVITSLVEGDRLFNVTAPSFMVDGTTAGSGMTIPESNTGAYGFIKIDQQSTVTLNGGTYTGDTDNGAFVRIFGNASGSTVNLNGVTMTSNNQFFNTDTLLTDESTPTLQVEGGTYTTDGKAFGVDTIERSPISFTDVAVTAGNGPCIEMSGSNGTFVNCDFKVTNSTNPSHFAATAVSVSWDGAATIDGGTYQSTGYGVYVYSSGGTITVKDGTIIGNVAAVKADVDSKTYPTAKASVVVEGGSTEGAWLTNGNENATLTVWGGTHTADVTDYLADGAEIIGNPEGGYTVTTHYVAEVDGENYTVLSEAIAAANGKTVKLLDNVVLSEALTVDVMNVTLDLNGKTISGEVIGTKGMIQVASGSSLTVTDLSTGTKGTIRNSGTGTVRGIYVNTGATLVLDGGINIEVEGSNTYGAGLYIIADNMIPPTVTIKNANITSTPSYTIRFSSSAGAATLRIEGGTFASPEISETAQLFGNDKAENITITGGTFHNWNAASDRPLVADGYSIVVGTDNSVTIQESAPDGYVARIAELNTYLMGGNLFNLIQRTGITSGTIEIAKNVTCTYPGGNLNSENGFGNKNENTTPAALTLDIAEGATLSGAMSLFVADVTVTGGGTVEESFFVPVDENYTVTSSTTTDGTVYSGRISSEKIIASVTHDGKTYNFIDWLAASNYAKRNAGSVLKLHQDVDYGSTIFPASSDLFDWTLDLNGHTYTYTGSYNAFQVQYSGKSLTITDSSEDGGGRIVAASANAVIATTNTSRNATVVIDKGVTIEGTILITGTDATLDVYGTIDTTANGNENAAIQTNGSDTTNSTINLYNGAVVKANTHAIYHPGTGTLNVHDGAVVQGGNVGIEMRAGTLNVYGDAAITGGEGTPSSNSNGSGTTTNNAAVAIAQHVTGNPVVFNAYGGTYTGGAAVYESNPEGNDTATIEKVEINIEDGMFDGSIYSEDKTGFVSGGIFTEQPNNSYVYPGLGTVEDGSGNFVIEKLENVYVDGTNGDDTNTGADTENAVKTLEHALNLVADDGVIYICGTVTIESTLTVSDVTIMRADGFAGLLLTTKGIRVGETPVDLTLFNVIIDGNKENNPNTTGNLLSVGRGSTVRLEEGTILRNNYTTAVNVGQETASQPRGNLIIDGGVIKDNGNSNATAGGVYNSGYLEMISGEISNNTADIGGGIQNNAKGELVLKGGEIKNNTANYDGGGIMASDGPITIDGVSITGNTSLNGYGGGIAIQTVGQSGDPMLVQIKSGTISDNHALNDMGTAIWATTVYGQGVTIQITGGTIAGGEDEHRAIAVRGEQTGTYPTLEWSGSPDVTGGVYLRDSSEESGYQMKVTGEFDPVNPIVIERESTATGIVAVNYAADLTPSLEDFEPYWLSDLLAVEGQNLIWADANLVYFYDENGEEYTDYRHSVIVDGKIDPADVPTPTKTGYTLAGWRDRATGEMWDFENDTVTELTRLDVVWSLNAPTVNVEAEPLTPHEGKEAVLTATADHELGNVTYSYQWYKDGVAITDATADTLNVSEAGSYTVKVKASDGTLVSAETESEPIVITIEGHIFDDEWKYDENTHWHECGICQAKNEEAEHSFVWVIDKEATNYETGLKHEECAVCGYAKGPVEIPMTSIPGSNQGQVGGGDWDWPEGSG